MTAGLNPRSWRSDGQRMNTVTNISPWCRVVSVGSLFATASLCGFSHEDTKLLRERTPDQRPVLMVLGTMHFANPGRDLIDSKVDDVLTETEGRVRRVARRRFGICP